MKAGLVVFVLVMGAVMGASGVYFAYTVDALDRADARVEAAEAATVEALNQPAEAPAPEDTHCESVSVGASAMYHKFRNYLLTETAEAEAAGYQTGFAVWSEKDGKVTSLEKYEIDRIVPPRTDPLLLEDCRNNPGDYELPKGEPEAPAQGIGS